LTFKLEGSKSGLHLSSLNYGTRLKLVEKAWDGITVVMVPSVIRMVWSPSISAMAYESI
jgi:hypothetical protein